MGDHVVPSSNSCEAVLAWALAGTALELGASAIAAARATTARRVKRGRRDAMRLVDFRRGNLKAVTLVEIERLGHAWSGGASSQPLSDPAGPHASRMAWAFIKNYL